MDFQRYNTLQYPCNEKISNTVLSLLTIGSSDEYRKTNMEFTKYIWDLYRTSKKGQKEIHIFNKSNIYDLSHIYDFELIVEYRDVYGNSTDFYPYEEITRKLKRYKVTDFISAKTLYKELIVTPVLEESDKKFNHFFENISAFTLALFHVFPEYFVPYFFTRDNYPDFLNLCNNFGIILPEVPSRHNQEKRIWYYFEINKVLQTFRKKHNIKASEFPAFLYFFGIQSLEKTEEKELPKPSRAYFLGAGNGQPIENNWDFKFLDSVTPTSTNTWGAGGLNIKKGDVIIMYCVSPRKYIHSIWRALDDSFIDPFSYHYYGVKVGYPKKIPPVKFQELKSNHILSHNPTVKAHMQGLNGRALSVKEYNELLNIIDQKGQITSDIPKLPVFEWDFGDIENERDVEIKLIEPLLNKLGFKNNDWVRQMPLRMGRQTKYYPDYAIKVNLKKGKEKAKIVLEAKYSINSDKQLQEAFEQARSYGLRLKSEKIVLADKEYVWVFNKIHGDFNPNPILEIHWEELISSDNMYKLKENLR